MGKGWKNPIKAELAAKKGKIFTKLAREISVAARLGSPDPDSNPRLKLAINAAKEASCPKDTIERAIKKGSGQLSSDDIIEETSYEGFGPHKVGVIVECQTNNKNRTVTDLRLIFRQNDGMLGEAGSVAWMFEKVGLVSATISKTIDPEEEAIEANANSFEKDEEKPNQYFFYGSPTDMELMKSSLTARGWEVVGAELSYLPKNKTELNEAQLKEVHEFLSELEDNDDTQNVYVTL
jgi:YebC/PmpR family DNA-binding regulatory protein